jgi:hypothetical protein
MEISMEVPQKTKNKHTLSKGMKIPITMFIAALFTIVILDSADVPNN